MFRNVAVYFSKNVRESDVKNLESLVKEQEGKGDDMIHQIFLIFSCGGL
jgi:hypothetical protein